jgi:hypothetical protein
VCTVAVACQLTSFGRWELWGTASDTGMLFVSVKHELHVAVTAPIMHSKQVSSRGSVVADSAVSSASRTGG